MKHLMIDLETLGTGMQAPIIEIGAVYFDENAVGAEFGIVVDFESCLKLGGRPDGDTIRWWMQQSDSARINVTKPGTHIKTAMMEFLKFVMDQGKPDRVWSNGANFDCPLVDMWLRRLDLSAPWEFWRVRDTRTLFETMGYRPPKRQTAHQAVEDARVQAMDCIAAWKTRGAA